MSVADNLRKICACARPALEATIDAADELSEIGKTAREQGIDWSRVKALLKAQILDDRDSGERVKQLVERADTTTIYADMLGIVAQNGKASPHSAKSEPAVVDAAAFSSTDSSLDGATRVRGNSTRFSLPSAEGPGREPAGAVVSTPVSVGSLIEAAPLVGCRGDLASGAAMAATDTRSHPDNLTIPEMLRRDENNRAPWMERSDA